MKSAIGVRGLRLQYVVLMSISSVVGLYVAGIEQPVSVFVVKAESTDRATGRLLRCRSRRMRRTPSRA